MMRALVLLAGLFLANGADTAACALDGAEAVDEMLDSAVYIMASMTRCGAKASNTNSIACAMDVSAAIESVNGMINVIMKAVGKCGALQADHYKCGLAVGVLTRSFAGLSSASAGIVAKCPIGNKLGGGNVKTVAEAAEDAARYGGHRANKVAGVPAGMGECIINVKDTFKALFKAVKRIMTLKDNCEDPASNHCAHNTLKVVVSFSALGEYLAGAVGKCEAKTHSDALCAQMSLRLVREIENVGRASTAMTKDCDIGGAERLYLEDAEASTPASDNKVSMALSALLPLTAVVAFVGGSRFARSRGVVVSTDSDLSEIELLQ